MRRVILTGILVLIISSSVNAAPRHFYQEKGFWISEAAMTLAVMLDTNSTTGFLSQCSRCTETNPFMRGRPTRQRVWATMMSQLVVYSGVNAGLWQISERVDNRMTRFLLRAGVVSAVVPVHLDGAIGNWRVISDCQRARLICR